MLYPTECELRPSFNPNPGMKSRGNGHGDDNSDAFLVMFHLAWCFESFLLVVPCFGAHSAVRCGQGTANGSTTKGKKRAREGDEVGDGKLLPETEIHKVGSAVLSIMRTRLRCLRSIT